MNSEFKPYGKYKESDLPWLGAVPNHWETRRMKVLFEERSIKGYPREPLLAATQNMGVVRKEQYGLRTVVATNGLEYLKLVEVGDFVISLRSFQGGIEMAHARGIISPAYTVLRPRRGFEPQYFRWYFKSPTFVDSMKLFVTGIREGQNIDYVRLSRAFMPVPPLSEQAAIVKYLNWATGRIDRAIRAKKKIVALLNEQKQAIIHQAVTRGLDPNFRLKLSGIPWLGEIPEHWDTPLNQRIFRERIRPHGGAEEVQLSLSQKDGLIATRDMKERSLQTASFKNWKVTLPGDLVLNRFKAHLGVFFSSTLRGIVSFHYGVFEPIRLVNTKYYELLYHTAPYRTIFAGRSNGMTVGLQNLSNQNFYNVRTVVPSIEEQHAIVAYTEAETRAINVAVSRLEREIELLLEYRSRLVSDVVTGKVDVREAAATLLDELATLEGEESDLMDEVADEMEEEFDV